MVRNVQLMGYQTNKSGFAGRNNGFGKNRVMTANNNIDNPDTIYKDDSIPLTDEEMDKLTKEEDLKTVNPDIIELEVPDDIIGKGLSQIL